MRTEVLRCQYCIPSYRRTRVHLATSNSVDLDPATCPAKIVKEIEIKMYGESTIELKIYPLAPY